MRRIMPIALLAASVLIVGAGCAKSTTPTPSTQPTNPAITPDRIYPGMAPYTPPTTPPPKSDSSGGPR